MKMSHFRVSITSSYYTKFGDTPLDEAQRCGSATRKGSDGYLYCDYCPDASVIDLNTMRPVLEGK